MDFHLTKEQLMLRKMYREFAENEVKPLAQEIDEEERFTMENSSPVFIFPKCHALNTLRIVSSARVRLESVWMPRAACR